MEEQKQTTTTTTVSQTQVPVQEVTETKVTSQVPKRNPLLIALILLIIVLLGVAGFLVYQNMQLQKQITQKQVVVSASPSPYATADPTAGWQNYTNSEFNYSLECPSDWSISKKHDKQENELDRTSCFDKPRDYQGVDYEDIGIGNFSVTVTPNVRGDNLTTFTDKYKIETPAGSSLIQQVSDVVLAGVPAKRFSFFGFDHTGTRIITVYNNKIFSIDFDGANPNDPKFDEHSKLYNQILSTFKFINSTPLPSYPPSGS